MSAADTLAVNQLLGRLVYFHVLFIEPSPPTVPLPSNATCCRHIRPARVDTGVDVDATPWSALRRIAAALGAGGCRDDERQCCPTCRVRACAATIVDRWIAAEHAAYGGEQPVDEDTRRWWSLTVADRIAGAFAGLHDCRCRSVADRTGIDVVNVPPAERFPLTGELARLWLDPTRPAPVISWLNHCAGLDDIAANLRQESTL